MNNFYIWVVVLISSYKPIVSRNLLQLGYIVNSIESHITNDNTFIYRLSHSKSVAEVQEDIAHIFNLNKMKYHSIIVTNIPDGFIAASRSSNIDFNKMGKTPSEEIETAMIRVNKILSNNS